MPFIGTQPAEVALTGGQIADNVIDSDHYVDGSIDTAHIAANQIDGTLTKDALIADYSDVTITASDLIMYGDATDSNNTKRDTVQGILDLVSVANDYEYVSVATGSGESDLSFTNMASGYDYIYVGDTMTVDSDAVWMKAQIGVAGSPPAYRSSGYLGTKWGVNNAGNSTSSERTYDFPLVAGDDEGMGTGTNEGVRAFECTLYNPANASTMTAFLGEAVNYGSTPNLIGTKAAGLYTTAEANTCVRFNTSGGTLTGTIYQFRRKRS